MERERRDERRTSWKKGRDRGADRRETEMKTDREKVGKQLGISEPMCFYPQELIETDGHPITEHPLHHRL